MEIFDILTFNVDKRVDLTMTDVYQEIANVSLLGSVLGDYEYGFSVTHQFDQIIKSEYLRFSIDGGITWSEFVGEPSDITDDSGFMYQFYKLQKSGDLNLIIQARKEDGVGVMTVEFVDAWIKRVR